ncbi:MAG TPA: tRNA (adenosine(37)-N6)-threonylcarbamoyltransferase complex ATPase subunit type 1 TsaE [Chitinophagaceae bacterium]|nr:tRNA (adenosine(37)-N6)-threonylcarbamoyltransferase complex ATPase subunit type 1 TsaE [Chitinophagaceae bacterium]HAN40015.1 tRNA (adenosine(37)-N6)-threonylcarbamoyltransferase complex ATPase subunit type 1 TsaE [Chitinophagaceae bacterium]
MVVSFEQNDIVHVAKQLWEFGQHHKIWLFNAPMGSGKTTLIHALCTQVLQVADAVTSPTFAIANEYSSAVAGTIYHMDWYRLKDEEEAIAAGVEDMLYSNAYCFIEWPEKAEALLPDNCLTVNLDLLSTTSRKLTAFTVR